MASSAASSARVIAETGMIMAAVAQSFCGSIMSMRHTLSTANHRGNVACLLTVCVFACVRVRVCLTDRMWNIPIHFKQVTPAFRVSLANICTSGNWFLVGVEDNCYGPLKHAWNP